MKYIVYILLFFPVWVTAQTYKYIGIEDGLGICRTKVLPEEMNTPPYVRT